MTEDTTKKIRGTREWAVANIDCCTGCPHGCKYCYARYDAVVRRSAVDEINWQTPVVRPEDVEKTYPLFDGRVMFPTTHDITPEIVDDCIIVLQRLIAAGNNVLVVSKPHLECVRKICSVFREHKEKLLLRFTITAKEDRILSFWEPYAPGYEERLACLRYAYRRQFLTSVSIEPMLESENIEALVDELTPWVTDSIWIGKMNKIDERVDTNNQGIRRELQRIREGQADERIKELYRKLKVNPLIRWKESIKEIVGIELQKKAGLDI